MKFGFSAIWCVLFVSPLGASDGWGTLKGRFIYDVDAASSTAPAVPGRPIDESLLVNSINQGVANVAVWVRTKGIDVHPDFPPPTDSQVDWQWQRSRLFPRVIGLRARQKLVVSNNDATAHFFRASAAQIAPFSPIVAPVAIKAGESVEHVFAQPETIPVPVTCVLHPLEQAWIVIMDNPYFAVTAADGSFEIAKLPQAELEFQFWHERCGWLRARPEWGKGRVKLKIAADEATDLGIVRLAPALLK